MVYTTSSDAVQIWLCFEGGNVRIFLPIFADFWETLELDAEVLTLAELLTLLWLEAGESRK